MLAQYERARAWILAHPAEAAQILAEAARLSPEVARKQLTERTVLDRDVGVPGEKLRAALAAVVPILRSEKLVLRGGDPDEGAVRAARARAGAGGTAVSARGDRDRRAHRRLAARRCAAGLLAPLGGAVARPRCSSSSRGR